MQATVAARQDEPVGGLYARTTPEGDGRLVKAAVHLSNVTKRFDDIVAVDDLTLEIRDGEFFSLLGPSGCGKTTTLRMIAGFEFPTTGSIAINGSEMGLLPANKRPVNTVFQSYALFPHMTILDNVVFGLEMAKRAESSGLNPLARRVSSADRLGIRERAMRALDMVRLSARADAKPAQLSGGQRQRVALARALVNEPAVLLLDEPLGALDLKLRQSMQIELKELQHRVGVTFVYVTHDQQEALTMSDRIGVMSDGKLLQLDTPEGLYEHPRTRFVADFIGEINLVPATVVDAETIEFADGYRARKVSGREQGAAITVGVRPERFSLAAPDDAGEGRNSLPGTVVRRVYHGDFFFYDVDSPVGTLEVKEENRPTVAKWNEGDRVVVHWSPDATTVVDE
ncbi:MAG TPA: ABC transporter ATP-binding protein [Acidimicrobiia bacterium]|nr:ABC transporter ATP-binding protein [Acidimicrobiia bacterium]